ncbi:MAG: S-methyl-5-thioribose-1-phosphate isomerase [Planctomycetes bacterium]|nr:S-methyl-5-thioribose-1-phosphate isomerase [Planctomycetota bacterium]
MPVATIEWKGELPGAARLIDQTLLPGEVRYLELDRVEAMWEAIQVLRVRGAPAIGIAAGYGVVLGVQRFRGDDRAAFATEVARVAAYLRTSRPTAVNLFWALDRMERRAHADEGRSVADQQRGLLAEARAIEAEDRVMCRAIGRHGLALVRDGCVALTHCNAGGLATADYGTALAPFFAAHAAGRRFKVFADETRPLLQGARLTAWELQQAGIDVTLICDNMAAAAMREKKIDLVIVGADRIAANGDTANKIGTYGVAVLARHHNVPFYVAAPTSTFDRTLRDGTQIPIEERKSSEITHGFGRATAPDGVAVWNPAFDVTPRELIAGIITEHGLLERPDTRRIADHFATHTTPLDRHQGATA